MSSGGIFNSLANILRKGGEQALALAKFHSATDDEIASLFERRFDPMIPDDAAALSAFSESMVEAGDVISGLPRDAGIDLSLIPANSFLFADEPGGRRVRFAFELEIEGIERSILLIEDFEDIPSMAEVFGIAESELLKRIKDSPGAFGVVVGASVDIIGINIPFVERRF